MSTLVGGVDNKVGAEATNVDGRIGKSRGEGGERRGGHYDQGVGIEVGARWRLELHDLGREHIEVGEGFVGLATEDVADLFHHVVGVAGATTVVVEVTCRLERPKRHPVIERA